MFFWNSLVFSVIQRMFAIWSLVPPPFLNSACAHQDPKIPQRLRQNCVWEYPVEVQVSRGLPQGQGLWVQQTWVWHKPSWRRSPLTPTQNCQNLYRTGEKTLGEHKQNLVHTRTQKKGAVTPQETDPDLPMSVQESLADAWVSSGLLQGWGHQISSACMKPFEGGPTVFITSTIVSNKEGTQPHPSRENWIFWAWPHPSEQDPVSPSVRLSHQEASISLLSFSIREQTDWKPQARN